jgi:hypothetical protein
MSITRESIIQHLYSTTSEAVPDSGLQLGEIAINVADEAVFIKNASGSVKRLSATADLTSNLVTLTTEQNISGDKEFSGDVVFSGDVNIEGEFGFDIGNITTKSTGTISVFDENATTVNIGGDATSVNIGATSGTTKVRNNLQLDGQSDLRLADSDSSHYIAFQAPTVVPTNVVYTLPPADGSIGQVLATNGSGTLSWSSAASGLPAGGDTQIQFNDGGVSFGGNSGLTFNKSTGDMSVGGDLSVAGGDITTSSSGAASVFNTNATTINIGGAATTFSEGYAGTSASTHNLSTGSVSSGNTKTVNIGTGGVVGSTTNVNIGSGSGGTTTVNKDLVVSGNLTVNGTTLTIQSETLAVTDPIITLGGVSAPSSNDSKDRGVEFRWHNGSSAKVGFFGYNEDIGRWTFIPDATNTSEVFSGALGNIDVNDIFINGVASTGTGAVVRASSPVISNSIGTASTLFNLINDGATTLNIGGAATSVSIGAGTGTATINNANTVVTGDLAVNGGDITTSAAAATLFNTSATSLNMGGSATSITMGDSSASTVTIRGGTLVGNTTTQNLFNTVVTTLNLGGAATVVNIGDSTSATTTIRGGTLVGNTATQNLFNTGATALNIGGAATALSLGAATGTATINNANTVVAGDLAVNGGDLTTSQTTFNLVNGTATTLNLGGAATSVSIGAATGTATINNANTVVAGDLAVNGGDITTSAAAATLFNTSATTLSLGGAATTFSEGYTGTAASTHNLATGAVASTNTKTINIGTGGAAGSTTNINLGSANGGTVTVNKDLTVAGSFSSGSAVLSSLTVDTDTLYVDSANNRVGVGTTTPGFTLEVDGSFAATTKSFIINHPTKPGKKLQYGSLEGPENGVYIRGRSNSNIIWLPDYWSQLVDTDSITVHITCMGRQQYLWVASVDQDKIIIYGDDSPLFFYTVYGERKDVPRLKVEG